MSEEEVVENVEAYLNWERGLSLETIRNLLDLYNKEKEKNKELEKKIKRYEKYLKNKDKKLEEILEYIETEKEEKIENAKWYIHQMVVRIEEDIEDYIDDDKDRNKHIIGELKETKKQWQDVEKLLNGESKDNLYNDWRKYGEYE